MIILNKGAVAKTDGAREIAPLSARKQLQEEVAWRRKALDSPVKGRLQDPEEMQRQAIEYEKALEKGSPIAISPEVKNNLWKKAKRLKDKFTVGMLSKEEMHPVSQRQITKNGETKTAVVADYDKMRGSRSVERNRAWYQKNENDLKEFKRVMRVLEPDNPSATDYEKFRPKTRRVTK